MKHGVTFGVLYEVNASHLSIKIMCQGFSKANIKDRTHDRLQNVTKRYVNTIAEHHSDFLLLLKTKIKNI